MLIYVIYIMTYFFIKSKIGSIVFDTSSNPEFQRKPRKNIERQETSITQNCKRSKPLEMCERINASESCTLQEAGNALESQHPIFLPGTAVNDPKIFI